VNARRDVGFDDHSDLVVLARTGVYASAKVTDTAWNVFKTQSPPLTLACPQGRGNFEERRVSALSRRRVAVPTIAFSIPIAAGKTEAFRAAHRRFVVERRAEFEASRARLGVTAERGFLQRTPHGDVAVIVFDVHDPAWMLAGTASSMEPIDVDFRRYLLEAFGLDVTSGAAGPPSEAVFEWVLDPEQDLRKRPGPAA
jgi:hypothetical protein